MAREKGSVLRLLGSDDWGGVEDLDLGFGRVVSGGSVGSGIGVERRRARGGGGGEAGTRRGGRSALATTELGRSLLLCGCAEREDQLLPNASIQRVPQEEGENSPTNPPRPQRLCAHTEFDPLRGADELEGDSFGFEEEVLEAGDLVLRELEWDRVQGSAVREVGIVDEGAFFGVRGQGHRRKGRGSRE